MWLCSFLICFSISCFTKLVQHSEEVKTFLTIFLFSLLTHREGNNSEDAEDFELNSVGREDEYRRRFSLGKKNDCYGSSVSLTVIRMIITKLLRMANVT